MSWLSRLFSRVGAEQSMAPPARPETFDFEAFGDRFVHIRSRDFFGQYSRSPDGRFLLTWRDGNDAGTHAGCRADGPGRFLLYEDGLLITEGRAERPNDGKVANDGTFVLNDWLFGGGLNGVFRAYRADGTLIVERLYCANLYNNGLADGGGLAVCQTCNAPSVDGSILSVFDLGTGREIANWIPESGWASAYHFPPDGETIQLRYRDGAVSHYSFDGDFLDRKAWIETQSRGGNLYVLNNLLKENAGAVPQDVAATILDGVEIALSSPNFDERQRAFAYKIRGACLETQGELEDALESYDAALALDPTIGVKRKAEQLRKALRR